VSFSQDIKRMTYEELNCDDTTINDLGDRAKEVLIKNGIMELFPV